MSDAVRDQNRIPGLIAETDDASRTPTPLSVDTATGRLKTTATVSSSALPTGAATSANQTDGSQVTQISALSTIYQGTKTVPTGTAEAITTTQVIHSVTVKALSTNTVAVYVGASGVTTANGFELLAGESVSLDVTNLVTVFVISGSASQVVRYIAV